MTAGFDPSARPEPPERRGPSSVSADLAAIFAEPPTGVAGPGASKVRAVVGRRGRLSFATLGSIAAAALVGLTGGALLSRPKADAPRPSTPATPAPTLPVQVADGPTVTLPTAHEGPIPVLDNAPLMPKPALHKAGLRRNKANVHRHGVRPDLMAADRRLRAAYSHAVRAGVPRHILAAYRNRWEDLRQDATWRPQRVAAGYGEMTEDLERMSKRPHGRSAARPHTLFGLFS